MTVIQRTARRDAVAADMGTLLTRVLALVVTTKPEVRSKPECEVQSRQLTLTSYHAEFFPAQQTKFRRR